MPRALLREDPGNAWVPAGAAQHAYPDYRCAANPLGYRNYRRRGARSCRNPRTTASTCPRVRRMNDPATCAYRSIAVSRRRTPKVVSYTTSPVHDILHFVKLACAWRDGLRHHDQGHGGPAHALHRVRAGALICAPPSADPHHSHPPGLAP
jgi:hypothetical protein